MMLFLLGMRLLFLSAAGAFCIFGLLHAADGILMTQKLPFGDPQVLALVESLERGAYGKG